MTGPWQDFRPCVECQREAVGSLTSLGATVHYCGLADPISHELIARRVLGLPDVEAPA